MGAAAVEVIRSSERAAALLDPTRREIVERLGQEPGSASGLARKLGLPRQRVNYHLRELERHRLVELVEERRKGNCTERVVRASARHYLISPEALGALGNTPQERQDRFSATHLIATAAAAVRDVAVLRARARAAGKRLPTLTLAADVRFASAESRHAFAEELANELARLTAKYHDEAAPGGRLFRFFLGAYPVITREGGEPDPESGAPKETSA
jgi:DNA-binding transcriptional ArsR family regulator